MKNYSKLLSKYRELILVLIDTICIIFAYILAYLIRIDFGTLFSVETFKPVFYLLPLTIIINIFINN